MSDQWPVTSIAAANRRLVTGERRFEIENKMIRGIALRVWKNAPPTVRDVFLNGRAFGNREFIVYEDERVTYDAFARAALVLAHELRSRGVNKGERIALLMRNLPEWPVAFYAAILAGAIVAPLNAWWTGAELEYALRDAAATVLITDQERLERVAGCLPTLPALERLYVTRQPREPSQTGISRLEDVIGPVAAWGSLPDTPVPEVDLEPEDDATIIYTSGTTGKPKGALGTHRNITTHVQTTAFNVARNFVRAGEELPEADPHLLPQRVTLLSIPLFHVSGLVATLGTTVNSGGKIVLMRRWDTEQAMRLIENERVTAAGGVPTIAWQLVEHPQRSRYDLSSLRAVNYGGAASSPELARKVNEVFPLAQAGNGWGMTETTGAFAGHLGREFANRPTSAGVATPVSDMKILSLEGATELPAGEVGELWVKGPQVAKGYWNDPRASQETFVDGWLRTGDLARLDEEGFLYLVDRMKDMVIRGGENIYCVEIENVLHSHPAVLDAAVVGIPHRTLGEEPAAVVHLRPGTISSETQLLQFTRARLAAFKIPVKVIFLDTPLPRNVSGKILKSELKKLLTNHCAASDRPDLAQLS